MSITRALVVAGGLCAGTAQAGPLDKPAFTATADELLAAAKSVPHDDAAVVVLRDEATISFDEAGRAKERYRLVFVVQTQAGVDGWGTMGVDWSPFYQNKPTVRARVIASRDQIAELDPKLVTDAPTVTDSPSVFSDRRELEAPLPRLAIGAVVEQELVLEDREPLLGAGTVSGIRIGRSVPVQRTIVSISAPDRRPVHLAPRGFAKAPTPQRSSQHGRTTFTFDFGPTPPHEPRPDGAPSEVATWQWIGYATGASWAVVAADYRKIVEGRIAEGPPAIAADLKVSADRAGIDRIVAWLHAHVRYTGIEFSQAAIVPYTPAETLKRGFGDCKDKATLLVALLRAAGIEADLALLDAGPGIDVERSLAGMGVFDHAIVRARLGGKDLWIDATEDMLPAGQLPIRDQGRLALVVAAKTTDLVRTPASAAAENTIREVHAFHVAEHDRSTATESSTETGAFWDNQRSWIANNKHDKVRKDLETYVTNAYAGKLLKLTSSDATDVAHPFTLTLEIDDVKRVFTDRRKVLANLDRTAVFLHVPALLGKKDDQLDRDVKERKLDYVWTEPFVAEVEYRLELPPGYTPPQLVAREEKKLGTMTLVADRKLDHDTVVITYRLDTGKVRLTPAELAATRTAVLETKEHAYEHVECRQTAFALAEQGKTKEAIAELQRLIALHPKEALHLDQLASVYRESGMGAAARRTARKAVDIEKTSDAYNQLGFQLAHDMLGRYLKPGADRKGAIDAYRTSLSLDSDHLGSLADLANLLAFDDDNQPTTDARDRLEAIKLWRHAKQLSDDNDYDKSIVFALMRAGSFAEAETTARAMPVSETRSALVLAAVAIAGGPATALHEVDSIASGQTRKQVILSTASVLLMLRRYPDARAMFDEVRADSDPIQVQIFDKLAVHDFTKLPPDDPKTPAVLAIGAVLGLHVAGKPPWDADMARELEKGAGSLRELKAIKQWESMPRVVAADIMLSLQQKTTADGNAKDGWRVELDFGWAKQPFYVRIVAGKPALVGTIDSPGAVGAHVLELLAKGDTTTAERIWKWLAADLDDHIAVYKDELARSGAAEPSKELIELGAAIVSAERTKLALPILKRCAAKGEPMRSACPIVLSAAHAKANDYAAALDALQNVPDTDPHAIEAIGLRALYLAKLGRFDDATKLLDQAMAKHPDDIRLLRARANIATSWADAEPWYDKLLAHPQMRATDVNGAAWTRLFYDPKPDKAKELGTRAEKMTQKPDTALLNTLAAIEAESDQPYTAWKYLQKAIERRPGAKPSEDDWYVIGRIAESYGLRDDAIEAYRKLSKPKQDFGVSGYGFARRHLAALGVH